MIIHCFIIVVIYYFIQSFSYWRRRSVPQLNQWNPLGDLWDVGLRYHFIEKIDVMYKKFKRKAPFFGFYTLTVPVAVVTDLDLLRLILVKDFNNFMNRGMYHNEKVDKLTTNIFNIEGDKWRRVRNLLSPTFTSGKMKGMFHIIEEKTKDFIEFIKYRSLCVDVRDANTRFTADVVASTAFGLETRALQTENPLILRILNRVFGDSVMDTFRLKFLSSFPKLSAALKLRHFDKDIEDFFHQTIKDTIDYREKKEIKRSDFLNMLINLRNRGTINDSEEAQLDQKMTFNQILGHAFFFFVAGYEASSTSMNFSMYFLGRHPEIQQHVRDEVREKKEKHGGKIDYEALMEMTYLNQVFNETLRIFSPTAILFRKALNNYKVPNTDLIIPKEALIQIPVHSIHHDPEYYPNPDQFDPDRFTPEEIAKRHPYAFLPFGEGPRNCIGMRFAQLQVKYALAVVVDTFELSVNPKTKEPLTFDKSNPNVSVEGGIWIDFKKFKK